MSHTSIHDNSWVRALIPEFVKNLEKYGATRSRSIKRLCPPGVWKTLSRGAKISAGLYFRNLTKRPGFPIVSVRKNGARLTFYQLRCRLDSAHAVDID